MQQSVRNVCPKFEVDPSSRFRTGACQLLITHKLSSKHKNCNIKLPLNTFSDQVTIGQISFEIFDVKEIDTRTPSGYFPFFISFFY